MFNNFYLHCNLILCINLLPNVALWDQYIEYTLISQVQNFINIWYLIITSEHKYPQYLISWSCKLPSYTMNVLYECTITTVIRTYQVYYYIRSSQIITKTRLSGMWTRKGYILVYILVHITYVRRWYYLSMYWYIYRMQTMIWYYYHMCQLYTPHMLIISDHSLNPVYVPVHALVISSANVRYRY